MIPINQLLSRIRWDTEFGKGRFEIGYFDRLEGTIQRVALGEMRFREGERNAFEIVDESGQWRRIPLHRIREVYRDGQVIWQRKS